MKVSQTFMATAISPDLIANLWFCVCVWSSKVVFIPYHSTNGLCLKNVHEKVIQQSPLIEWGQLGQVVRHNLISGSYSD